MGNPKKYRAVISSTHIDSHGDRMSLEALEQMVEAINNKDHCIRMGVDHRKDFPPKGRIENASLKKEGDYYLVEADFCEFEKSEIVDWNETLIKESFPNFFQFAEVDNNTPNKISILTDPHNFKSYEEYKKYKTYVNSKIDLDIDMKEEMRKSAIPDPEIIFQLASSFIFYQLLKPVAKQIGEKVSDDISDYAVTEGGKIIKLIDETLREFLYRSIPKTRPASIIFDFPGTPHIELIARTRDKNLVLKSLSENKIADVKKEIEELSKHINIAKVQFLLSKKGKWKFNYLITSNGEAIGKKISFENRDKRIEMIHKETALRNKPSGNTKRIKK